MSLVTHVAGGITPEKVVVHPLVLLSVTEHYHRVAKNTKRRVVGVLLGQWIGSTVNVANSYARKYTFSNSYLFYLPFPP